MSTGREDGSLEHQRMEYIEASSECLQAQMAWNEVLRAVLQTNHDEG